MGRRGAVTNSNGRRMHHSFSTRLLASVVVVFQSHRSGTRVQNSFPLQLFCKFVCYFSNEKASRTGGWDGRFRQLRALEAKRSRRCIDGDVNQSRLLLGKHITQVILNALAQRVLTRRTPSPISVRTAFTHTAATGSADQYTVLGRHY